jgi:hypothetical protein
MNYCKAHPDERFWQALRNWSGFHFIMGVNKIGGRGAGGEVNDAHDTFYMEGRNG